MIEGGKNIWWIQHKPGERFKEFEKENIRLKSLVANLSLGNAELKDFASVNL